jgi:hypothetical protein
MDNNSILLTNLVHIVYIFTGCANPNYSRIQSFLKHFEWLYIFNFSTNTDEDFFKSLLLLHESDERINKVVPFVPEMFIHQYIGHVHQTVWGPKLWSLLHGLAAQKNTTPVVVDEVLHNLTNLLPCAKCGRGLSQWLLLNPVCGACPEQHINNLHNHVNQKLHKQLTFIF